MLNVWKWQDVGLLSNLCIDLSDLTHTHTRAHTHIRNTYKVIYPAIDVPLSVVAAMYKTHMWARMRVCGGTAGISDMCARACVCACVCVLCVRARVAICSCACLWMHIVSLAIAVPIAVFATMYIMLMCVRMANQYTFCMQPAISPFPNI